jgi:hypothetical protein
MLAIGLGLGFDLRFFDVFVQNIIVFPASANLVVLVFAACGAYSRPCRASKNLPKPPGAENATPRTAASRRIIRLLA